VRAYANIIAIDVLLSKYTMADTSSDVIDALLQFSEGVTMTMKRRRRQSNIYHPSAVMPVPNPLDPTQPHLIEGDIPLDSGLKSTFTSAQHDGDDGAHDIVVSSLVPNPLIATPAVDKQLSQSLPVVSAVKTLAYLSTRQDNKKQTIEVTPNATPLPAPTKVMPTLALPEKISTALNSKPQRGKKRDNLSEEERIELTKARNKEARNTR